MNACGFFVLSRLGQSVYTLVQMVEIMSRLPFKLTAVLTIVGSTLLIEIVIGPR